MDSGQFPRIARGLQLSHWVRTSLLIGLGVSLLSGCERNNSTAVVSESPAAAVAATTPFAPSPIAQLLADNQLSTHLAACDTALEQARAQFDQLLGLSAKDALAVFDQLNQLEITLEKVLYQSGFVAAVFTQAELREAAEACEKRVVTLISDINLSRPLYDLVKATDPSKLSALDIRYRRKTLENFERAGVNLPQAERDRVKQLQDEITEIGQAFDRNIRDSRLSLRINSEAELDGLPADYIARHQPNDNGQITLSTAYPDYTPFMQYATHDAKRKEFYLLFLNRATPVNDKVLHDLVSKRHELATLLGFSNFAEFVTADKMIGAPQKVDEFLHRVSAIAGYKSRTDLEMMLESLKTLDPRAERVEAWQSSFLTEQIKQNQYQVSAQEVRQYFQYANVRDGMFTLVEQLFDVQIKPWQTPVWHESVGAYEMWDKDQLIGRFYLDMHPREGKYNHAAQFSIVSGVKGQQITEAALVCNFSGEKDPKELLEHSEVVTFLHEFGHLIHNLFAGVDQTRVAFSGIKTEWDFVEAPSQMLQEWAWDAKTLQTFATNSKGEAIPTELVEKMVRARNLGRGVFTRQQLFYAALSLNAYATDPAALNFTDLTQRLQASYSPYPFVEGTNFHNSFGHLNGYSAIYYTYMWSQVIAMDLLSAFKAEGLQSPELAARYRAQVLAPGGQKDAADLVKDFLGREHNFAAFSKSLAD